MVWVLVGTPAKVLKDVLDPSDLSGCWRLLASVKRTNPTKSIFEVGGYSSEGTLRDLQLENTPACPKLPLNSIIKKTKKWKRTQYLVGTYLVILVLR